ncbi:hypothetical protein B7494_g6522 [Chlorociboria aeruginascens]|nr:hypothetical protein B7494_g6522 [Chlorociboria aeruginascens]
MISRSTIRINVQLALRRQCCAQQANRRGFAVANSGLTSFSYNTSDVGGIKVANRDVLGPTTKLAVVAKAGTRYEPAPGLSTGLEQFAFKNTLKRSALRLTRESELLGGQLVAYHTREALVIEAKFLREDLPYFTELLGEVVSHTKYTPHEYHEQVEHVIHVAQERLLKDVSARAIDSAHGLAFHRGLGAPLIPSASTPLSNYLHEESIEAFAERAYTKSNISVVANGADPVELIKWVGEFFDEAPDFAALTSEPTKYYGGEERITHTSGNAFVIAFPGSSSFTAGSSYKPELAVLAALLGGKSTIKWSPGFSLLSKAASSFPGVSVTTSQFAYSDAGLLTILFNGPAGAIRGASADAVKVIKSIAEGSFSKEDLTKAIALAKYRALEEGQSTEAGLVSTGSGLVHGGVAFDFGEVAKSFESVIADKLKTAAKTMLAGKATVSAIGDLHVLPFAEDIGLKQNLVKPSSQLPHNLSTHTMAFAWKASGLTYNKYLSVAAQVVRRSLKDNKRLQAEKRGETELRFAKWTNGKQGDVKNVAEANAAAMAEHASGPSS